MKKTLLISSLVIIAVLFGVAYQENLNMDWQKYQKKYKYELTRLAKTEKEKITADNFKVKMLQIVLPEFNKADRCITCHVAMEDYRMSDMPQPLTSHPGDYLDIHDVNKVGCTFCHDGQGQAITTEDAHAQSTHKYWEKPILEKPFQEATCVRCHVNPLAQTPHYNNGKKLFKDMGCISCHKVGGKGGTQGPDLSNIGDASFHVKAPIAKNREEYLNKFHENVNLAYLYESVTTPKAQPSETTMPDFGLDQAEPESLDLVTYLKSFSSKRRVMDVGFDAIPKPTAPIAITTAQTIEQDSGAAADVFVSSKGYTIFQTRCIACHTIGEGKRVGPDLKGVAARRKRSWLKRFIQTPSIMLAEKDPIAIKLLEEYKTTMTDLNLSNEEVEEVIKFLENPVMPPKAAASTTASTRSMGATSATDRRATKTDITKGQDLFQGKQRLFNGGPSCITCHNVRNNTIISGGTLAKELTTTFSTMGSVGIGAILENPPFPLMREAYKNKAIMKDEVFALVSFLEEVDKEQAFHKPNDYGIGLLVGGICGAVILMGIYSAFWCRRKKNPVNKDVYDRQIKSE